MYPRRKDLFTAWAKAMVEGSTVDKPNYSPARGPKGAGSTGSPMRKNRRRKKRRKKVKAKDA